MSDAFLRNRMLWGDTAQEQLRTAHVILFGLGGVGSYTAECLTRAGIGELTIVDSDTVSDTNRNRQLEALASTVGQPKTDVMAARLLDIQPQLRLHPIHALYSADSRARFFPPGCHYDYVVDAIDLVSCKLDLIETAQSLDIPIISAMGTGNKLDPSQLQISDITQTAGCPLARVMRRELRRRGIPHLQVVYSPEKPMTPLPLESPPPGRRSLPASNPWVPAVAGILLGSAVVRTLIATELEREVHRSC